MLLFSFSWNTLKREGMDQAAIWRQCFSEIMHYAITHKHGLVALSSQNWFLFWPIRGRDEVMWCNASAGSIGSLSEQGISSCSLRILWWSGPGQKKLPLLPQPSERDQLSPTYQGALVTTKVYSTWESIQRGEVCLHFRGKQYLSSFLPFPFPVLAYRWRDRLKLIALSSLCSNVLPKD